MSLADPFQLGELELPNGIFYAPLAGCSDFPFRQISAEYRPGLIYCEMVKMDAMDRNDSNTFHLLDYSAEMHPIGAQLCGSKPKIARRAAKMIEDLGFDVLDFNCGCPVDKVTKDGSGSGMLKTPDLLGEVLSEMVAAVKIPVTVKIRAGWGEDDINGPLITEIAEQAGAQAICVHGRTRQQAYRGPANWDWIRDCVDAAETIKVICNGDIFDAESALKMVEHTGCHAVLVSRGTMGCPWIVEDIIRFLRGQEALERSTEFARSVLEKHYEYVLRYSPGKKAVVDARRIGCWYLKKSTGSRIFREKISKAASEEEAMELIRTYSLLNIPQEVVCDAKEPLQTASSNHEGQGSGGLFSCGDERDCR